MSLDARQMSEAELVQEAIALADKVLREALAGSTRREQRQLHRLGRLVADPGARELVQRLTDDVIRIGSDRRAGQRFADVVGHHQLPPSLTIVDRLLLRAGARLARPMPRLVMPLVRRRILGETKGVVLPAEDPEFAAHAALRRGEGIGLLVNPLGESILGDGEAKRRVQQVLDKLCRLDVDAVSIKVSALVANLDVLDFDRSIERICEALREIYRAALLKEPRGFVNLDMEEYRDLQLTVVAFTKVLDEPEFHHLEAGIVLQAYLPDSHAVLEQLGEWACARRRAGGAGIKVRIVKGANLAMESVEAELHDWAAAPYPTKAEVDASFKMMLDSTLRPEWNDAVRIGVASHNLFDVAWALVLRDGLPIEQQHRLELEMLEGMAPAQTRAVRRRAGSLMLYAPVVQRDQIDASIAYLSRRLDENTAPENFLRALFTIRPGSEEFAIQADRFRQAVADRHSVSTQRRRHSVPRVTAGFTNEPDSDPTDPAVRERLHAAVRSVFAPTQPPIVDTIDGIDAIVVRARAVSRRWAELDITRRREIMAAVAAVFRDERFDTIQIMAAEAAKVAHEGDPEVSEAIDFAEYYGTVGLDVIERQRAEGAQLHPRGVVVVASPWNFPYAIPSGGVLAALAAGNVVILKPPPEARCTALHIVAQLHRGGVPDDVVQFAACPDNEVGQRLISHPDVDSVILTGSYETAAMFRSWKPSMHLLAETSGKNAIVITQAADLDLAIRDLVRSAFGHAGQKCSAASLAIVEAPLYDDKSFMERLADATRSLVVGPPSDPGSVVGPLIGEPSSKLQRGLTQLDNGEQWLVEPRDLGDDLWSPGVRVGVRPGSWFHVTECFGPVLGVMRADDLDQAIELQNATPYGLTGGIHSLDEMEVEHWLEGVRVGNAYVNRGITGAIVQRQPFGGWKRSSVGCGPKAGGPDYVAEQVTSSSSTIDCDVAERSYRHAWSECFSRSHDPTGLVSEHNELRYRRLDGVLVRVGADTPEGALQAACRAAEMCGTPVIVSDAATETESALVARLEGLHIERLRLLTEAADELRSGCCGRGIEIDCEPVSASGRRELRRWLREQAISRTAHRHGRVAS
ncbi:MAG TPA: bifunctional proline dehydrogenase/L-glutamate gamma-semialdehyde dehydrogenase [Ilumatobacteraceae bacterium]|nr:bifunctional proline dehydrogenase/L-glutamate gamma-semialdehyde dehydrogenase [Ilumatobacteraceae bacterium]